MSERKYIERFNPCVEVYDEVRHKDFLKGFNCNSFIFNKYITSKDIIEDKFKGDGVTYLVFDERVDEEEYDERLYGVSAMQIKMFAVDV